MSRPSFGGDPLQAALTWDEQGHLTEPAITALADAEISILSDAALRHADTCAHCADRVGQAALLALDLNQALKQLAAKAPGQLGGSLAKPRPPLPLGWITAGLLLVLLGAGPSFRGFALVVSDLPRLLAHAVPALARVSLLVVRSACESNTLLVLSWSSSALLILLGLAIVRVELQSTRRDSRQGEP